MDKPHYALVPPGTALTSPEFKRLLRADLLETASLVETAWQDSQTCRFMAVSKKGERLHAEGPTWRDVFYKLPWDLVRGPAFSGGEL